VLTLTLITFKQR